ncbi:neutral amino acid transporter [Borealophlyctis nickersoniae]|nr:neutral amino acid transporter [Borealophlyctis nickersoniae]
MVAKSPAIAVAGGGNQLKQPALPAPSSYGSNSSFERPSALGRSLPRSIPGRKSSPPLPSGASIGSGRSVENGFGTPPAYVPSPSNKRSYGTLPNNGDPVSQLFAGSSPDAGAGSSIRSKNGSGADEGALSEADVARLVSEHLVQPSEAANGDSGEVTRDIYQWQERRESIHHRRRNSEPGVPTGGILGEDAAFNRASDFHTPGMFRRHFVHTKAENEGNAPPNLLTANFMDFLALYGFYGGDVMPDYYDDEDVDVENGFPPVSPGGVGGPSGGDEEPAEDTPLVPRSRTPSVAAIHGTSDKKAFFMLLKAFVGTGVLFLPKAFANGGMGFSIILMVIIAYLTLHCMMLLVETSRELGGSFGDLGEKLYGPRVRQLVLASIALSQNLRDFVMVSSNCKVVLPDWAFIIFQLLLYIPLAWIRKIKHFSLTSLIADVFILLGLSYVFYYDITILSTRGPAPGLVWFNMESFPLFVGTAMFAFEGICLILPIAESMKRPDHFNRVLTLCIVAIAVIFIVIGAMGYLTFGTGVETIVFLNLPKGPHVLTIQLFYAAAIMLSFPLTVYPTIRITEQAMFGFRDGKSDPVVKWQKNFYRAFLVGVLGGVAYFGSNNLDKFVSLVGCFACIPLSFIYPSLFHYHIARSNLERVKDLILAAFGTAAMVYTTYVTLEQWATGAPDVPMDRCAGGKPGGGL